MTKKLREQVRLKYNGLCAYTGKPLGDDWQIDHVLSKYKHWFIVSYGKRNRELYQENLPELNNAGNFLPACRIVNHYKRALDLEGFRRYMKDFHRRLGKLPKKTVVERTRKRKEYMWKIADLFDITPDKPFKGTFYFETLKEENDKKTENC